MTTDLLERPEAAPGEDNQILVTLTLGDQLCGVCKAGPRSARK